MAAPVSVINTRGQSMDSIYLADGTEQIKLAVGTIDVGLDADASWQGVATHTNGGTMGASDGVVILAGVDVDDGVTVRRFVVSDEGYMVSTPRQAAGPLTDLSGTITTGDTSQELAAAKADRKFLLVQNQSSVEDLWINFGIAAVKSQPSVRIPPDGIFTMEGSFVSSQQVTVIAATTAHAFTAKEG